MSSTHIPGPWVIERVPGGWGVRAPSWGYVAIHDDSSLPHWNEGQEANRRLIAAAPELLEALEGIANHYDMDGYGDKAWKDLALEMADLARAAIAKATG